MINSKRILRKKMKSILNSISSEEKARQSNLIQKKVLQHEQYKNAKRISIYLSLPSEVDTRIMLNQIFLDSKKCFIPRYKSGTNEMVMLELDSIQEYENLPFTNWNIKQFSNDCNKQDAYDNDGLDLMILPGFAFTLNGKRLGKGGGYYDTYLNKISKLTNSKPYLIGLAFKEQILNDVPVNKNDFKIDEVITI